MKIVINKTYGVVGVNRKYIIENDNELLMVELYENDKRINYVENEF